MELSGPFDGRSEMRALIEGAPVPVRVSGADSSGVAFNTAWLAFTGRTLEDELGEGWLERVHPDDRADLLGTEVANPRRPFWAEFRLLRHDGVYRRMLASAAPRVSSDDTVSGHITSCVDITDRDEATNDADHGERLRVAVQKSPVMFYRCDRDLRYTWVANPPPMWSADKIIGRRDDEILQPYQAADLVSFKQRVIDTGVGAREEISLPISGGTFQAWDIAAEPLFDAAGQVTGLTVTAYDITMRKIAEDRQRLLTAELDHRVRNTLAAIQSLVALSARSGQTKEEYTLALQGRIDAYNRIYGYLASMQWQCANLNQIALGVVQTFGSSIASRFRIDGANLMLSPAAAISLNLILHELATNAVRHGAAAVAHGRVALGWEIREGCLILTWRESGGPAVPTQMRPGFGTRLIRQLLAKDLRATFQLEYPAEGALLTASIPLKRLEADTRSSIFSGNRPSSFGQMAAAGPARGATKARILLVEDDPLIGLEFQNALADAGVEAVGPMSDVHHSLSAIMGEGGHLDAAILDVNLRGESTLPLAQLLAERGVPYLFVSGYDLDTALPTELRQVPKLQKPVSGPQLLAAVRSLIGTAAGSGMGS